MSRSARNRVAKRTTTVPRGTVQPRQQSAQPDNSIRCVGYLGRNKQSVSYSGSGDAGYKSEWSRPMDYFTDQRWSQTVSNQNV